MPVAEEITARIGDLHPTQVRWTSDPLKSAELQLGMSTHTIRFQAILWIRLKLVTPKSHWNRQTDLGMQNPLSVGAGSQRGRWLRKGRSLAQTAGSFGGIRGPHWKPYECSGPLGEGGPIYFLKERGVPSWLSARSIYLSHTSFRNILPPEWSTSVQPSRLTAIERELGWHSR